MLSFDVSHSMGRIEVDDRRHKVANSRRLPHFSVFETSFTKATARVCDFLANADKRTS